jgi:hypothetical protein
MTTQKYNPALTKSLVNNNSIQIKKKSCLFIPFIFKLLSLFKNYKFRIRNLYFNKKLQAY